MFSSRKAHLSCDQVLAVGGKGQSCDGLPVERKEVRLKEQHAHNMEIQAPDAFWRERLTGCSEQLKILQRDTKGALGTLEEPSLQESVRRTKIVFSNQFGTLTGG